MKIYSVRLFGASLAITALLIILTCCTKVNDNLGTNIVPDGQRFEVRFATLKNGISTYTTINDSVVTSGLSWAYVGSMNDATFGRTSATGVVQFFPDYRTDTVDYSAEREKSVDSMWIITYMRYVAGDTLVDNNFDVYRLDNRVLYQDSTYYNSFDYKSYIGSEAMFSFTLSGNATGENYDTIRLVAKNAALADDFMRDLIDTDTTILANDTLFANLFGGLCITPQSGSATNNTLYRLGLAYEENYSMLVLYGHDFLIGQPDSVKDIIVRSYLITDDTSYSIGAAVSCFEHDYAGTSIAPAKEYDTDWGTPQQKTYVQGFLGADSSIEFTDAFVNELKALVPEDRKIFINQAAMRVAMVDATPETMDAAPERLGTYFNVAAVSAIPDYNYYYEANNSLELNYGGELNRTHAYYSMDIAVYLQKLIDGDYTAPYRLSLSMPAYDYLTEGQVALFGEGSATPIEIAVTYTVIGR